MPAHGLPARWSDADGGTGWMRHGACLPRTDLPWTADGHRTTSIERLEMAAVCAGCPVLARCSDFAALARMTGGFWAGAARDEASTTTLTARLQLPGSTGDVGGAA
jgi:Transcription factor WhiB